MGTDPTSITSPSNPTIKAAAALHRRRARTRTGTFLVEGRREVLRALAAPVEVRSLFLAPAFGPVDDVAEAAEARGVVPLRVGERAFRTLSVRQRPDGVAAVVERVPLDLDRIAASDLVLVADGIEKPGNLGAMLRTADAVGAAVVVADPVVDVFNPNVVRASQGALFTVPLAVAEATDALAALPPRRLLVARPDATTPYWTEDLRGPTAVVVGREDRGVSEPWLRAGAGIVVPMRGVVDSLNASVAAAVVLYEALRQRLTA